MEPILDIHTHAFPAALAHKAVDSLAGRARLRYYLDGTLEALRRSLENAGISHGLLLPIAVKPGQEQSINAFAKSTAEWAGGPRIIPFASVHPFSPDWREQLAQVKGDGFRGIKLHPNYQRFFVDDERVLPFYRELVRLGLAVLFHAGFDNGIPAPIYGAPARLARILGELEGTVVILAHMGGNNMYGDVLELLCGKDIYFDTSFSLSWMDADVAKEIFRRHTPDRMLFGTDSPWRGQKEYLALFRRLFGNGFLCERDMRKVLWENGARLLGLEDAQAHTAPREKCG